MSKLTKAIVYSLSVAVIVVYLSIFVKNPAIGQIKPIEIVAEFPAKYPPGNIAVTPKGRLIMSLHQFYGAPFRVVEIKSDGNITPYPNQAWSSKPDQQGIGLNGVLGIRCDQDGIVWMLDGSSGEGQPGKIVAWDTINEQLSQVIYLPQPIIKDNSLLNDLAIDLKHNAIYITDSASGDNSALIVVDLNTGFARRVLEGDISTRAEDIPMVINQRTITLAGKPAKVGANPITIDPDNQWVYYAPMSSHSLYRLATKDLLDTSLSEAALSQKIQRYGDKPICDGITVDDAGNVYLSAVIEDAIAVVDKSGKYRILYQDSKLLNWANALAFSPDNYIYVTVNQLQNSPPLNNGKNDFQPPFYLLKFPALASGEVGR